MIAKSTGDPLSFDELKEAIKKSAWNEIPGLKGMSHNAIKLLDDNNKRKSCDFGKEQMENDEIVCFDWTMSTLATFSNKGYLYYPRNWRGINLLNFGSKILSIILNVRAQKTLKTNCYPIQF